ncbi:MAG: NAD(P)H-hydrate dehydratase [Candidatus Limimorpha sp.]
MKIPTITDIRGADAYTIENEPVSSIDLMERASCGMLSWLLPRVRSVKKPIKIFSGMGNNGGDGLALSRLLFKEGVASVVFIVHNGKKYSDDCAENLKRLKNETDVPIFDIESRTDFPEINDDDVLIDAIVGSGLSRPLEGLVADLITHLNDNEAIRIAVDIASGLNADLPWTLFCKDSSPKILKADYTLSMQFPKMAFLYLENDAFVGRWEVIDINIHRKYIEDIETNNFFTTDDTIKPMLHKRGRHSHKGTFGHALLIAGSEGKTGAALLAAESCLRSGVGLLTVHLPKVAAMPLQVYLPEAMISVDKSEECFSLLPDLTPYSAVGVGPGLGKKEETEAALKKLVQEIRLPLVLDADALNIISENKTLLSFLPEKSILTPHPKEFERLFGKTDNSMQRLALQCEMSQKYKIIIVLKGANTSVSMPNGACFFNSTGNAGMATGGSGDVLTGMILSLLAQRYSPEEAAVLGVFLHGRAGDIAAAEDGMESLIASDISKNIGKAFKETADL